MSNRICKKIYKKIKQYDRIVIARHIGPDPDALGSSIGLRDIIKATFPDKEVYVVGNPASKFKFIGELDKFSEEYYNNSLLIITDTPDRARIDGVDARRFESSIKIDHHPFIEKICDIEWVDDSASSASQMIIELALSSKFVVTKEAAEKLYSGLVADTNRFLFYYTTSKTFSLVAKLIEKTNLDFTELYKNLYMRSIKEIKFKGYISNNLQVTENGFGYLKLTDDVLVEYEVDAATAGNMVNDFNYIEGVYAWGMFTFDKQNDNIRGSIRSRGPIINKIASNYNGGGHIYASGVRVKDFDEVELLVKDLDIACKEYKESSK